MTMRGMVEEMYREFKKGRSEDSSTSQQDKETKESFRDGHSKSRGKEEKLPTPPNSPKNKKKASLIKLDVKFDLPIYDGELNAEKLDNWIRQILHHGNSILKKLSISRFVMRSYICSSMDLRFYEVLGLQKVKKQAKNDFLPHF